MQVIIVCRTVHGPISANFILPDLIKRLVKGSDSKETIFLEIERHLLLMASESKRCKNQL